MCDICVIESVKKRMLTRRSFLKKGLTAGAGLGIGLSLPSVAQAKSKKRKRSLSAGKYTDLTHTLHENFPTFGGAQQFFRKELFNYEQHKLNMLELRVNEHTGTHVDAPLHFSKASWSVEMKYQ